MWTPKVIPVPFDPIFLLLIVPILAGLIGQRRVRAAFARYRGVPASAGLTGAEAAQAARPVTSSP